jgi:hypothetical protein
MAFTCFSIPGTRTGSPLRASGASTASAHWRTEFQAHADRILDAIAGAERMAVRARLRVADRGEHVAVHRVELVRPIEPHVGDASVVQPTMANEPAASVATSRQSPRTTVSSLASASASGTPSTGIGRMAYWQFDSCG